MFYNIRDKVNEPVGFSFFLCKIFSRDKEKERGRHIDEDGYNDPKGFGRINKRYFHIPDLLKEKAYTENNDQHRFNGGRNSIKIVRLIPVEYIIEHRYVEQRRSAYNEPLNFGGLKIEV